MKLAKFYFILALFTINGIIAYTKPIILYTDIISGPNSGGENNKGVYLSIFGKNFGNTGLGTNVKVYINNVEIDNYRFLGTSMGRSDIQQITVQIGAVGNPAAGVKLPVKVTVNGESSNTDQTFMVNPGRILFVDNTVGSDATAVIGDISHPFRHLQTSDASAGAYGKAQPGDIIVMRGKGTTYNDIGLNSCFLRFLHKSGNEPTGQNSTGPIVVMPYPGQNTIEQVKITNGYAAISGVNRSEPAYQDGGAWIIISGLYIESSGTSGVINLQILSDQWRIVNNDLSEPNAASVHVRAAGVSGNGTKIFCYGNTIHDITGSSGENHGIYIDGDGSYDFGYNNLYNINDGYGIQQYNVGTNGPSETTSNMLIHHNLIHDVTTGKSCINIADGSASGIRIWNNICYNARNSGLRFNSLDLSGCQVYNNTFYNTNTSGNYGVIQNDWANLTSAQLTIVNNIVYASSAGSYLNGQDFGTGVLQKNLWYGAGTKPTEDPSGISGDPKFAALGSDFHLLATSPAINVGSNLVANLVANDFDAVTSRPQSSGFDIGAIEYVDNSATSIDPIYTPASENEDIITNYPNPFTSPTTIIFKVERAGYYILKIYDMTGREMSTLFNENKPVGEYKIQWNLKNGNGNIVDKGIYLVQLKNEFGLCVSKKMVFN